MDIETVRPESPFLGGSIRLPPVCVAVLLLLSGLGCATGRTDLVRAGRVSFEIADCPRVLVSAKALQDGEEMIVTGRVTRRPPLDPGRIHLDVRVTAPTGETVDEMTALVYPRTIPIRRDRTSRFAVWFPFIPPQGSTIRLMCHSAPHGAQSGASGPEPAEPGRAVDSKR